MPVSIKGRYTPVCDIKPIPLKIIESHQINYDDVIRCIFRSYKTTPSKKYKNAAENVTTEKQKM